jgi:hypothetical protein
MKEKTRGTALADVIVIGGVRSGPWQRGARAPAAKAEAEADQGRRRE